MPWPTEYLITSESPNPLPDGCSLPPSGSVYDVFGFGHGWENVYSDLVGAGTGGHDLITDTLVTPFGNLDLDWLVAGVDAAAVPDATFGSIPVLPELF